jgi:hypothetical protein
MNNNRPLQELIAVKLLTQLSMVYWSNISDEPDSLTLGAELKRWMDREGISQELTNFQRNFLNAQSSNYQNIQSSWLEEQVGVFAWALGFAFAVEDYETQIQLTSDAIYDDFHFLSDQSLQKICAQSNLRERHLISEGRNFYMNLVMTLNSTNTRYATTVLTQTSPSLFHLKSAHKEMATSDKFSNLAGSKSICTERLAAFNWLLDVY